MDWNFQASIKNSYILVVDDNIVNQKVLSKVLESNGYNVDSASDGFEALTSIFNKKPDLILLDVQMPKMDGFEVCRRLKADPASEEIPVIFITASDTVESKVEGFNVGAVDYIARPLQMPEVLARVSNQLTIQQLQRNSEEEKERLERILAALPVPYLISNMDDGSIVEMNNRASSALDVSEEDYDEHKSGEFYVSPDTRPELLQSVKRNGLVSNQEIEMKTRAGEHFTALFSATPLKLGGEDVFFVTFNDISERKKMELALEKAATTDYLTETLNRRAFTERCNAERQRANRNKEPICLFMIDIDHFKGINDTHGHEVGDTALKVLVELVGRDLRSSDALGRIGGEEFALVLPETELEGAVILAERIRERIENNKMDLADGETLSMTISGGLTVWQDEMTYEAVLKVADDHLYKAKNSGRNQIVKD